MQVLVRTVLLRRGGGKGITGPKTGLAAHAVVKGWLLARPRRIHHLDRHPEHFPRAEDVVVAFGQDRIDLVVAKPIVVAVVQLVVVKLVAFFCENPRHWWDLPAG